MSYDVSLSEQMETGFEQWVSEVPKEIRQDSLWKVQAYRLALYAADIGWEDVSLLAKDRRTWSISDQLNRSLGGISSTIAEGYSRGSGRDRARFYDYALGSSREARDWYFKARHVLGEEKSTKRIVLLTSIIRLLLTMVPDQRGVTVHEERTPYSAQVQEDQILINDDGWQPTDQPDVTVHESRITNHDS